MIALLSSYDDHPLLHTTWLDQYVPKAAVDACAHAATLAHHLLALLLVARRSGVTRSTMFSERMWNNNNHHHRYPFGLPTTEGPRCAILEFTIRSTRWMTASESNGIFFTRAWIKVWNLTFQSSTRVFWTPPPTRDFPHKEEALDVKGQKNATLRDVPPNNWCTENEWSQAIIWRLHALWPLGHHPSLAFQENIFEFLETARPIKKVPAQPSPRQNAKKRREYVESAFHPHRSRRRQILIHTS